MLHQHVHHVAIVADPLRELCDASTGLRIGVLVLVALLRRRDSVQDIVQACCLKNMSSLLWLSCGALFEFFQSFIESYLGRLEDRGSV